MKAYWKVSLLIAVVVVMMAGEANAHQTIFGEMEEKLGLRHETTLQKIKHSTVVSVIGDIVCILMILCIFTYIIKKFETVNTKQNSAITAVDRIHTAIGKNKENS